MSSFSDCKIGGSILAHDLECNYLFKLVLSCNVTRFIPLSGPIVHPPLLGWRYDFRRKERDGKNVLKWGGVSKKGKVAKSGNGEGGAREMF